MAHKMPTLYGLPMPGLHGSTGIPFSTRVLDTQPTHLLAYWPYWEAAGPTAFDQSGNSYDLTPFTTTWGEAGIGDGNTIAGYDGLVSLSNMYSVGLASALDFDEGSFLFPFRVANASVWTTPTQRRILRATVDSTNQMSVYRTTTNNQMLVSMVRSGISNTITVNGLTTTNILLWLVTWSVTANKMILYSSGVKIAETTCSGAWVGPLHTAKFLFGAYAAATQIWYGDAGHIAWWKTPLSAEEALNLGAA